MPKVKIKLFVDSGIESNKIIEILSEFKVDKEIIKISTGKGKKLAKEWVVNRVPYIFFVSNDEKEKIYYSDNTIINKQSIKGAIKFIEKKFNKKTIEEEIVDDN